MRATLPAELAALNDLVMNLRWSWHQETLDLFASVDPEVWQACGGDPVRLLGGVSPARLAALAQDERFLRRLAAAADDLNDYLGQPRWYQEVGDGPKGVAYFSMEFGLTEVLPQYSGGLGILAGDHLKAASDLGVPIVGVGLLYRAGYFAQGLSKDGWQQELYPSIDPHGLPLALVRAADGTALRVSLGLPGGRTLRAQVWKVQVGRVPLLLLDSDIEENEASERQVTDKLYGGTSEHRMAQEMLAGVGGVRAVRAYCELTGTPAPDVFHTNEGHAGFLGVERIRELAVSGLTFDEALQAVRAGTVFTTHTPVPAGIDRFGKDLVRSYYTLPEWAALPVDRVLELGAESDPNVFNMAHMGLRLAQRANGVSKLHGEVSRDMFQPLWPGFDTGEVPITSVTNGVHAPTWMSREILEIAEREVSFERLQAGEGWDAVDKVSDEEIWAVRRTLRERLVEEVRRRLHASQLQRGPAEAELDWTAGVFDPDVLTVGFARRVPSYKRLTLMLRDPERLRALLLHPERPIQIVVAGKSHPADDGGKSLIQQLVQFADDPTVRHRIVFLPDYDIGMARYLYWGCDVWLNNPLRPLEACGTSGMKAALNGGLNLSIRDGWWDEMYDGENGWAIPSADGVDDDRRDDIEAAGFYSLVETQVAPRFYDRRGDGPGPLGGDGPAHPQGPRPAGAGHPDGPRLRHPAVRAGRGQLRPGVRRRLRGGQAAGRLADQGARRLAGGARPARRVLRRGRHPGAGRLAVAAGRGRPGRAGPVRRRRAGRVRAGGREQRAARGAVDPAGVRQRRGRPAPLGGHRAAGAARRLRLHGPGAAAAPAAGHRGRARRGDRRVLTRRTLRGPGPVRVPAP